MSSLWLDLRTGIRAFRATPGQSLAAALALCLGIAAAVILYTAFRVIADDLPAVPHPERVARLYLADRSGPMGRRPLRVSDAGRLADQVQGRVVVATGSRRSANIEIDGCANAAPPIAISEVSPQFFSVAQVQPQLGRFWTADDALAESPAVLGADLWRRACGGDPSVIGRTIRVDRARYQVAGVMPDGFWLTERDTEVWLPSGVLQANDTPDVVARLDGPGTWLDVNARFSLDSSSDRGLAIGMTDPRVRRGGQAAVGLFGPALLVLFVACGNAAALLVGRALRRGRDMALRLSLGATPGRLAREAFAEAGIVACLAAMAAIPVAAAGTLALRRALSVLSPGISRLIVLDTHALGVAAATAVVATILTGLLPSIRAARTDILSLLPRAARQSVWRRGHYGAGDVLVVVQMALAVVLVVVTLMFISVLSEIAGRAPGPHPAQVVVARLRPPSASHIDAVHARNALAAVKELPGISAAALTDTMPLAGGRPTTLAVESAGKTATCSGVVRTVTPEYFEVIGLQVRTGGLFAGAPWAAVVSETLARRCWGRDAIVGQDVVVGRGTRELRFQVVGVVTDAGGSEKLAELQPADLYLPFESALDADMFMILSRLPNAGLDTAQVGELVRRAFAGSVAIDDPSTLTQVADRQTRESRVLIDVLGVFAAVAFILATMGVYASMSQSLARRTRTLAIRMALGASPASLVRLTVARDSMLVTVGAGAGLAVTLAITRVTWPDALAVGGTDPGMWLGVCGVLAASGLCASIGPVTRAMRLDPMAVLRSTDE